MREKLVEKKKKKKKRILLELSDYNSHPRFLTPSLRQVEDFLWSTWESRHVRIGLGMCTFIHIYVYIYIDLSGESFKRFLSFGRSTSKPARVCSRGREIESSNIKTTPKEEPKCKRGRKSHIVSLKSLIPLLFTHFHWLVLQFSFPNENDI